MNATLSLPSPALESALPRRTVWTILALVWTVPGLAALSYYYLNQTVSGQPISWSFAFVSTLPNWYLWAAMTPAIVWLGKRYRIERDNWKTTLLTIHLPAMVLMMLVHSLANLLLFYAAGMPGHETLSGGLYRVHFTTRVHANLLTYWTVLGVFYAYDYYRQLRLREQQSSELQIRLIQANLRALKMQLQPHFLFNTLNSVAALVRKKENNTAIRMLVQLSDFLRLALENKGRQEIPLRQELDFLERYLNIEKIRFQERLTVTITADPSVQDLFVPNMILQPLVENAIHHGIAPKADAGRIEISARIDGGRLVMQVLDDGPGMVPSKSGRTGVGLVNIRERLKNLYGTDYTFTLQDAGGDGLLAEVSIPVASVPVMKTSEEE
ncbi:MAG: two-component system LytT family sensor kinase [Rhodothermales bacterium]|jgi:two-component system LytT family sensor kinase